MPDRETVIKEKLDEMVELTRGLSYAAFMTAVENANDILALLKEQEKGEWIDHTFAHGDDIECPFCHKKWDVIDNCTETFDYCPGCGAKLS